MTISPNTPMNDITEKQISKYRWPAVAGKVRRYLVARGIEITKVTPWTEDTDLDMHLGGEYEGVSVQVGDGYASLVHRKGDDFHFIDIGGRTTMSRALNAVLDLRAGRKFLDDDNGTGRPSAR